MRNGGKRDVLEMPLARKDCWKCGNSGEKCGNAAVQAPVTAAARRPENALPHTVRDTGGTSAGGSSILI